MDLSRFVDGYWQNYLLSRSADHADRVRADGYRWAWELAVDVAGGRAEESGPEVDPIDLMVALAERAPDDRALSYLGAGPIEEYLRSDAPDLDAIERAARRNSKFRTALRGAWFDDEPSASDGHRLRRFGPPP